MVSSHGQTAIGELGDAHLGDAGGDIEVQPDRRMAQADLHVDRHQDAEVDRVDAELDRHRKQDRRHDQDDRRRLHHVAGEQQQDVDHQQEADPAEALVDHPVAPAPAGCSRRSCRNENSTALVMM